MSFMLRAHKETEEGKYAVCPKCGQLSADYNICEGCNVWLPEEPRYFVPDGSETIHFGKRNEVDARTQAGTSHKRTSERGKYASCPNCGYLSMDYNVCDCCQHNLPEDIRFWQTERIQRTNRKVTWSKHRKGTLNEWHSLIHSKKPYGTKVDIIPHVPLFTRPRRKEVDIIPHVPLFTRPRRKETEDGKFAVCPTCGHLSSDYNVCESCHAVQPIEPNYVWPDWPMIPENHKPEIEEIEESVVFFEEAAVVEVKEEEEEERTKADYSDSCAGDGEKREQFAMCPNCHHLSLDYNTCTGCDTPLPKKARFLRPGELVS